MRGVSHLIWQVNPNPVTNPALNKSTYYRFQGSGCCDDEFRVRSVGLSVGNDSVKTADLIKILFGMVAGVSGGLKEPI